MKHLVGDIPQGLPPFSIPKEFGHFKSLIPTAMLITGVVILESVGIAKVLVPKNGYELDSNQELCIRLITWVSDANERCRFRLNRTDTHSPSFVLWLLGLEREVVPLHFTRQWRH
ncbi:hypothetical protein L1887_36084 [Cichorium endivia]|nr:hypothetical protein L1887_36084 [Cichorium endivia]